MSKKVDINSEEYKNIVEKLLGKKINFIVKSEKLSPTTQCIKVDCLRKKYNDPNINLKKWMEMENNLYVGRHGRIFINKEIFHYPASKWQNPYKVSEYSLGESLDLYEEHIRKNLVPDLQELSGKSLGCFCDQSNPCHTQVLVKLYNEFIH